MHLAAGSSLGATLTGGGRDGCALAAPTPVCASPPPRGQGTAPSPPTMGVAANPHAGVLPPLLANTTSLPAAVAGGSLGVSYGSGGFVVW